MQTFSSLLRACTGVLMLPLSVNMLRPLDCSTAWLATGLQCWRGAHLGLIAISFAIFAAFSLIVLSCACELLIILILLPLNVCMCCACGRFFVRS